jgi:predicted small secreted protein
MRTSMMLALMSLSLAACATDDGFEGDVLPGKTVSKAICPTGCDAEVETTLDNGEWIPVSGGAFVNARSAVQGTSACASLPTTGQCAYACDPIGFAETLPAGTCAAIRCEFPGGELVVGGCSSN